MYRSQCAPTTCRRALAPRCGRGFRNKARFRESYPQVCWHSGDCVAVQGHSEAMIQVGRLLVNLDAGVVSVDDQPVHLTGKEYGCCATKRMKTARQSG